MNPETQSSKARLTSADDLFRAGMFAEAEKTYSEIFAGNAGNFHSALRLGYIAMLSNRLDDAHRWLTRAREIRPEETSPKALLAEMFYRHDDFNDAAVLLRAIGKKAMAKKLDSFSGVSPYRMADTVASVEVKFIMTDPLPVIEVQVNKSDRVNFFIDTGGAEVIIDNEFAKEVNAANFGSDTGTFAGGKQASIEHGRVDSIILNDLVVKNIPVTIMDVRRFSKPVFRGKKVDGIIGTVLLYHFLATINYPEGKLVLQPKTRESLQQLLQTAAEQKQVVIPFWMGGDHYMVAWGTVNRSQPMLFFVDTGLAGGGFSCPESTLKEANIQLKESAASEGIGGGGKLRVIPFIAEELTLGEIGERNIHGSFMGVFPLENAFGFHIGGLVSHEFFKHYALTMDFTGMKYYLKSADRRS